MNTERFEYARRVLAQIPDGRFKLAYWRQDQRPLADRLTPSCNTIACAGGWLTLDPYFQSLGFSANAHGVPIYKHYESFEALATFFDFDSHDDAVALFARRASRRSVCTFESAFYSDKDLWEARAKMFVEEPEKFRDIYVYLA